MRHYLAAAAALSTALVLAACGEADQTDDAASPEPEAAQTTAGPEPVSTVQTCAGYYDGNDYSVDARVTTWAEELGAPDDDALVQITTVRDRLASLIFYAEDAEAQQLEAIQAPFAAALAGEDADADEVAAAADTFRDTCVDAGYEVD